MIREKYYALKRSLGGEKMTGREKLCWHWYPTPGCNMHREIIGERRGRILFVKYVNLRGSKAHLIYWRTHPAEWAEIQRRSKRK